MEITEDGIVLKQGILFANVVVEIVHYHLNMNLAVYDADMTL